MKLDNASEKSRIIHNEKYGENAIIVDGKFIDSDEYRNRFNGLTASDDVNAIIYDKVCSILKERTGTKNETLIVIDADKGTEVLSIHSSDKEQRISYKPEDEKKIIEARSNGIRLMSIHNHPTGYPPTADDCVSALERGYEFGITCGHNGTVYAFYPAEVPFSEKECEEIHEGIASDCMYEKNINVILDVWRESLGELGMMIKEKR